MAIRAGIALLLFAVLLAGFATPKGVAAETTETPFTETAADAPIIIETVDESIDPDDPALLAEMARVHDEFDAGATRQVAQPVVSWPQAASVDSGMSVTFDATHTAPPNVQAVVLAAAQKWDAALATTSSGPVEIAVIWKNLGSPSLLGSAGPNGLYSNAQLPSSSLYPVGQVNTLLATDRNGSSNAEVIVNINSTSNWYIGTSGAPGSGQVDLLSVVLHEIGHGLGFIGSPRIGNHPGPEPTLDHPPFVYDESVTHNGQPLLQMANPNSVLESNNLRIDLSSSLDAKLYAPGSWQDGSSFSHFDEATYGAGAPGALMTPSIGSGQLERELDAAVLGVLAEIGWPMRVTAVPPSIISVNPATSSVIVQWSTDLRHNGVAPDGHRVEAWRDGTLDSVTDIPASTSQVTLSGLQPASSYELRLVPHAHGIDGLVVTQPFATTGAPSAPAIVSVSGATLTQTISWSAAAGPSISGYEVQRSTDGVGWIPVGSTSGLSVAAAVPQGVHQYRVRGLNSYGVGKWGYSIPTGASAGVARPVALDGQIDRLYRAYFLRDPDPGGFAHWVQNRAAGTSQVQIADAFAGSDEFIDTYGHLSNQQFVHLVYQNVLGRSPDAAGNSHWTGVLASGGSRGSVMAGFSDSAEFIDQTGTVAPTSVAEAEVYRLYVAFFVRFPDAAGLQYWTGVRESGGSLESIATAFAASTEFNDTYGSLPDDAFTELVYNNVLGRSADGVGLGYWLAQLGSGVDRGAMMVGFSESTEFVVASGTTP